jgi:GntR family transcriptional regulator
MTAREQGSTSDAYVIPGASDAWSSEASSRGQTGTQRLIDVVVAEPTHAVREALELSPSDHVVVRTRLILLDGQPVEIARSHYPGAIATGTPLAGIGKIRGGAIAALAELGHAPVDVAEQVTARWPDADEAAILQVDEHEPMLVLTRVNRDAAGRPVEYAANCMVARLSAPLAYRKRIPAA